MNNALTAAAADDTDSKAGLTIAITNVFAIVAVAAVLGRAGVSSTPGSLMAVWALAGLVPGLLALALSFQTLRLSLAAGDAVYPPGYAYVGGMLSIAWSAMCAAMVVVQAVIWAAGH